jgi:hypothetical protein
MRTSGSRHRKDRRQLSTIDANLKEVTERLEVKTEANNEKFEVLRSTLVLRMDIHQPRTVSTQEEMKSTMDIHQEKMEAAIRTLRRSELQETIKHRVSTKRRRVSARN